MAKKKVMKILLLLIGIKLSKVISLVIFTIQAIFSSASIL